MNSTPFNFEKKKKNLWWPIINSRNHFQDKARKTRRTDAISFPSAPTNIKRRRIGGYRRSESPPVSNLNSRRKNQWMGRRPSHVRALAARFISDRPAGTPCAREFRSVRGEVAAITFIFQTFAVFKSGLRFSAVEAFFLSLSGSPPGG